MIDLCQWRPPGEGMKLIVYKEIEQKGSTEQTMAAPELVRHNPQCHEKLLKRFDNCVGLSI